LDLVVERLELALCDAERERDQPVGKPGVLGQQRPVQIRADRVAATGSLVTAAPVVAVTAEYAAERLLPLAEAGAPAVILKSREDSSFALLAGRGSGGELDRDVPDQAWTLPAHGGDVEQPHALDLLVPKRVVVAEQLKAAAHAEHDRAARRRRMQRGALGLDQVLGAQALVAVLAPAEVEEVVCAGIEALARAARGELKADSSPCAATLEHEQVASVGVYVHEVRIQGA